MRRVLPALVLLLLSPALLTAAAEYRLVEHLGFDWPRQMIGFPVTFPARAGHEVVEVTANGQPVPFQTPAAEITRHADGTLKTAQVYVLTALPPEETIVFVARTEAEGRRRDWTPRDLRVIEEPGRVTLEAGATGIRLPLGTFTENIPAPYQGFKLATGRWVGSSQLLGTPGPLRLQATITERGPIFAEVELQYTYPEDRAYTLRCRVIAGEPVALFSEEFNTEPGSRYHRNLPEFPLRFRQGRFGYSEEFAQSHQVRIGLSGFQPNLAALESYADQQKHAAVDPADPWLATLHPWQSWHGGTHMLPLYNEEEYLGLMTLHAGQWVRPLENLLLVRQAEGQIFLQVPINHGARVWGVHFGTPQAARPTGEGPYPHFERTSPLRQARLTYGETALDTVKDWVLAWEDATPTPNPVSVSPRGDLPAAHARFAEVPELAALAQEVVDWWQRYWAQKAEADFAPPTYGGVLGRAPDAGPIAALYLCTGRQEHARFQFLLTRALLDYGIHQTLRGTGHHQYHYGHDYGMLHMAAYANSASQMTDPLLGSPYLSAQEKNQLRSRLAFYAYLLTDPDYWPPTDEIGKGNFNMVAAHDGAVGVIGCVLAGHPAAARWQQVGAQMVERTLANNIYPDGVVAEGTHYAGVTLDALLPFMALLANAGGKNYFQDENLKRGLRWYAGLCPPRDVRFGRAYMPPYGYSHPTNTSQSARWAVAAAMTHETDPEFAALMMDTWERQGRPVSLQIGGQALLGMIDPRLLPDQPVARHSQVWENFGAVLRAHAHTPYETYMSVAHRGGWPNENGGVHLYAKGAPLSLIFGARAYFDPAAWYSGLTQNRVIIDRREEPRGRAGTGRHTWVSLSVADLFGTEFRFTQLQGRGAVFENDPADPGKLELSEPRPWPKGAPSREDILAGKARRDLGEIKNVPPQNWWRHVMFVKDQDPLGPNYFLIRDSLTGTLPSEWNLWVMAEAAPQIRGQEANFTGKFGVNLEVFMAIPPAKIVTGAWGRDDPRNFERQHLLQLQQEANGDYLVVLYPYTPGEAPPEFLALPEHRGVRLQWPRRTDWLLLNAQPVALEHDGLQFVGQAGLIQKGEDWARLTLLVGEKIALGDIVLMQGRELVEEVRRPGEGSLSVTLLAAPGRRLLGEATGGPREVVIHVPAAYAGLQELLIDSQPAPLRPEGYGIYAFQLGPGDHRFEIR